MEILVTEEKKKIFRARKTMKISDRQQLESLHTTLLTAAPTQPDASPPALVNGSHKEELPRLGDAEQNCNMDSNSLSPGSPTSPTSQSSPGPFLSLNLSPSSVSSQSPKEKDDPVSSPASPFHSLNLELKRMEEEDELIDKPIPSPTSTNSEAQTSKTLSSDQTADALNGIDPASPQTSAVEGHAEPAGTKDSKASSTPSVDIKSASSNSSSPLTTVKSERKNSTHGGDVKEGGGREDAKEESASEVKMEVDSVEVKSESEEEQERKSSRPSSTPPSSTAAEDKSSLSGIKRTLSEGHEKEPTLKREGKRPKMERELEAELEVKITTKARDHCKLEKIVQQLVNERLEVLQQTFFEKHFQELKGRVDKIECGTKHQSAINQLQAKIARLSKKFGEANQASENKRKQEALAAAAPPPALPSSASTSSASPVKPPPAANQAQVQRIVRASIDAKQIPSIPLSSTAASSASAATTPVSASTTGATLTTAVPMSTAPTIVGQAPILQLLTSNSSAVPTLGTGITTSSSGGTYLLKTPSGGGVMAAGQPLLIQLPLSMASSQTGALVKIPVSSLSAANTFNNTKTTAAGTTLIFKPGPVTTTTAVTTPAVATIPAIQTSAGQKPLTQISLTRAVYQGGTGGIVTPHAGVSVTTARTQAQSVSVAGALSSISSLVSSLPAATGSAAPGPPQGVSLTSKTDNQASGASTSKAAAPVATAAPAARPKGSVIDLTEDDDDVQVTGVKKATVVSPPASQRPHVAPHVSSSSGARSSPQTSQNSSSPATLHYRPPSDSAAKPRTTSATPTRGPHVAPPPLPAAPIPPNLPPDAERTSPPQQPQLKLVPSQSGIVLSWCVSETDLSCATVESYHLYAYHQESPNSSVGQPHWKKIGEVKALPLPMACTLTQFQSGSTYHFAVRAKDIYGRFGPFCEPQCTNVSSTSS